MVQCTENVKVEECEEVSWASHFESLLNCLILAVMLLVWRPLDWVTIRAAPVYDNA